MKKFKLFVALFAMLALGVTNALGAGNYVKVTSAPTDWSGDYLIVYENGKLAFNGELTTLDAVSNTVSVTITDNQIAATDAMNKARFTINASGHIKSASGYSIGQTSNANGLKSSTTTNYTNTLTINDDASVNIVSGGAYLRYNATSGQTRFRYYKSSTYTSQKAIHLYKYVEEQGEEDPDAVKYTVSAIVNDEEWGSVSGAGEYAEGDTATITATPNPGYEFDSWDNGSKENPLKLTVTSNALVTAIFIPQTAITIKEALALADGTTGVLNYFTVSYVNGSNIYIQDESGYALAFKYNYGLKAGDGVNFMAFTKSTYNDIPQLTPETDYAKLTIIPGEAPAIAEITSAPTVADNRLVKLMNVSLAGPLAKKSTTVATCADESTINIYSQIDFTPEEGKTYNILGGVTQYKGVIQIQAYEVEEVVVPVVNYNIYLTANPAEAGTVEGAGEYVQGTSATLTATPAEGYDFTCWTSGNDTVSTDNPLTLTVSADTALVANFAKKTFTIDVNVTPAESGTVTGLAERGVYEYGATATLTATPADNYEFVFWAAGEDTLSTETTYSFEVKDNAKLLAVFKYTKCTPLNAPVVTYTTTYNSATLTWEAVDNAEAYLVTVGNFFNQVKDTTYTATGLEAATEYTYSVQAISGDPKAYCDSEATYGALTTAEAPAATLTLSENGETRNLEGDFRLNELVTLPTTAAECSKTFVGWDSKADCAVAPEYAPGAEYQLNELTQTLYAVYADAQPGETVTIAYSGSTTANMGTGNNADKVGLDATQWTVIADKGQASNNVGLNKEGTIRLYYNAGGSNTLTITAPETIATVVLNLKENYDNAWVKVGENTITPSTAGVYTIDATTFVIGNANTSNVQVHIYSIEVTLIATEYTNYSTTCSAAPVVEVAPAEVTATVEGTEGEITVAYENVLLEKVAISLYNDQKCTEAFTGDWLTATLDADYNITYTVAASTLYTEREAYILLTAPAVDGTEPATALIPVTQAGKEAVFASLEELLANVTPTKDGINVTVTLTDEEIVEIFVTSKGYRNGVNLNVPYQNGTKEIQIYCYDVPESWVKGGKVSGTITCPWKDYNGTWELCPKSWDELTYTAPTTTALDNAVVAGKTTKMIINGQLIIVKDGVQYNAQGAQL